MTYEIKQPNGPTLTSLSANEIKVGMRIRVRFVGMGATSEKIGTVSVVDDGSEIDGTWDFRVEATEPGDRTGSFVMMSNDAENDDRVITVI